MDFVGGALRLEGSFRGAYHADSNVSKLLQRIALDRHPAVLTILTCSQRLQVRHQQSQFHGVLVYYSQASRREVESLVEMSMDQHEYDLNHVTFFHFDIIKDMPSPLSPFRQYITWRS